MDVTDEASVERAVAEVMRREGRIDALVHCAGISLAGSFEDTTVEEAKGQFDTNFFGAVRVMRAVLPVMREQARGKIIVIGSIGGLIGLPYIGYYSASKFALDGLVRGAAHGGRAVRHRGDRRASRRLQHRRSAPTRSCAPTPDAQSAYDVACRRNDRDLRSAVRRARPADVVARRIERLLSRRRLPVRSVLGTPSEVMGVWLKSVLPSRSFEYLFRKSYKL